MKKQTQSKIFAVVMVLVLLLALCSLVGCSGETEEQRAIDELRAESEELSDRAYEMQRDIWEMEMLLEELQEANASLAEQLTAQTEANASLSARLEGLQNGIFALFDLDFTREHADYFLSVYVKPEYVGIELTPEDFLPAEISEVRANLWSPERYTLILTQSGDKSLLEAAIKLYSLEFVDRVELAYSLSGASA